MNAEEVKKDLESNEPYLEMAISLLNKEERLCLLEKLKQYVEMKTQRGEYDLTRKMLVEKLLNLLKTVKPNLTLRKMTLLYINILKKDPRIAQIKEKLKNDELGFTECSEILRRVVRDE
ncbi:MAG: hypothetical protein QXI16_07435 [Sulfolobaceae archaeon]